MRTQRQYTSPAGSLPCARQNQFLRSQRGLVAGVAPRRYFSVGLKHTL